MSSVILSPEEDNLIDFITMSWVILFVDLPTLTKLFEPRHEKTNDLHMRKQRRRSALR